MHPDPNSEIRRQLISTHSSVSITQRGHIAPPYVNAIDRKKTIMHLITYGFIETLYKGSRKHSNSIYQNLAI